MSNKVEFNKKTVHDFWFIVNNYWNDLKKLSQNSSSEDYQFFLEGIVEGKYEEMFEGRSFIEDFEELTDYSYFQEMTIEDLSDIINSITEE